jgi:hypothetical protein
MDTIFCKIGIRSNLAQIQYLIPEPVQDLLCEYFTEQVVQVEIILKKVGRPRKNLEFDNVMKTKSNVKRFDNNNNNNNNNHPIRSSQRINKK